MLWSRGKLHLLSSAIRSQAFERVNPNMSPANTETGRSARAVAITLALGVASTGLYVLLFVFADRLPEIAAATRNGETPYGIALALALVPILIALVFSFVHGAFTGRFWDLLGLRAKR